MGSGRKTVFYTITSVLTAGFLLLIYSFRTNIGRVLMPFLIAALAAYILNPLIKYLESRNIPRKYGILLAYLFFLLFLSAAVFFVVPEIINNVKDLISAIPDITSSYQDAFNSIISVIRSSNWPSDIKEILYREIDNGVIMIQDFIINSLRNVLSVIVEAVTMFFDFMLAMFITYYLLKDAHYIKNSTLLIFPRRWRRGISEVGRSIDSVLSNFIQGQLLIALIVAVMEVTGLLIAGIRYPFALGLIGGAANIIPYFGPIIGAVPAVAVALIDSPLKAVWAILVFVVVQQIENAFISPRIIEGKLGLHPVTTILAVLLGGEFFGVVGMLLAVPAAAIFKVLFVSVVKAIV
jgi:predicted PurR-regulated permease PerM